MKNILFRKNFFKGIKRLHSDIPEKFEQRLAIYLSGRYDSTLHIHQLSGNLHGTWSMNITGDIRALFEKESEDMIVFIAIGTHSYLFGK